MRSTIACAGIFGCTLLVGACGGAASPSKGSSAKAPAGKHMGGSQKRTVHWSYDGAGDPSHWGEAYCMCTAGRHQSPIDIRAERIVDIQRFEIDRPVKVLSLVHTGHSLQASVEPVETLTVEGVRYALQQFHFHTPSEHATKGTKHAMEMHLVHKSKDGRIAVVGVLFDEGEAHPVLQSLLASVPTHAGEKKPEGLGIPMHALVPNGQAFTYDGSLTTPPCSEGVTWFVAKEPSHTTHAQIQRVLHAEGKNARPVQSGPAAR